MPLKGCCQEPLTFSLSSQREALSCLEMGGPRTDKVQSTQDQHAQPQAQRAALPAEFRELEAWGAQAPSFSRKPRPLSSREAVMGLEELESLGLNTDLSRPQFLHL